VTVRENESWIWRPWPRAFLAAVAFLTRIPMPDPPASTPMAGAGSATVAPSTPADDFRRALVFFPLVGALIGGLAALALLAFSLVLPWPVAVLAALAVEARITGALHEDAVADFCDAFGGGTSAERILQILKDSRVGSYGTLGLGFAVAIRAAGLVALGSVALAGPVLVISGCAGRVTALAAMAAVPPLGGREGLAEVVGGRAGWQTAAAGALVSAPVLALGIGLDWIAMIVLTFGIALFLLWYRQTVLSRLGGATGDCIGFAAYAGIVVATLAFARLT